eukprot:scaffold112405_cov93-Phaeocystis_antarctica.AAC.1
MPSYGPSLPWRATRISQTIGAPSLLWASPAEAQSVLGLDVATLYPLRPRTDRVRQALRERLDQRGRQ